MATSKQLSKELFVLARDFAQVFCALDFKVIKVCELCNVYQKHFRTNLSLKSKFGSAVKMVQGKLPIFDYAGQTGHVHADTRVRLSKKKLAEFFFLSVLDESGGKLPLVSVSDAFVKVTGISYQFLYKIFNKTECKQSVNEVLADIACSVSSMFCVTSEKGEKIFQMSSLLQLEATSLNTESIGVKHTRKRPSPPSSSEHSVSESTQPLAKRTVDTPIVIKSEPEAALPMLPQPLATPHTRSPLLHTPNARPHAGPPHEYQHPINIQGHGTNVPIRIPPPVQIINSGSTSYRSPPDVQGAYIPLGPSHPTPQTITPSVAAGQPISMISTEDSTAKEKFPNPDIDIDKETLLPSHVKYRPDLAVPPVQTSKLLLPLKKKSRRSESKDDLLESINVKLEEIIEELSSKGKFVPVDFVRNVMHDIIRQANSDRYPAPRVNWRDVKTMENYSKLHGRVEELIKIFCLFNPITSLYELEQALILTENVQSFEQLRMGPLHKHPRVKDLFKPPDDLDEIPKISSFKIRKYLMAFLSKRSRGKKSTLEEFLEFIRAKEFADTMYHLCLRVTSYSLAIQMNFRFRTTHTESRKRADRAIESDMAMLVQNETERLRRKLSSQSEESIRRDLAGKNPIQVLLAIFDACQKYFTGRVKVKMDDFLNTCRVNPVLRNLFLLAIYEGAYDAEKHMVKLFGEDRGHDKNPTSFQAELYYQTESDVLKELLCQLTRIPFPIDLGSLARVEKYLAEKFCSPNFDSLGNGSFVNFLATHKETTKALGGEMIGASSRHSLAMKRRLLSVVQQLNPELRTNEVVVSTMICTHFNAESFQDLGCGHVSKLIADSHLTPHQSTNQSPIRYMEPLLVNGYSKDSTETVRLQVGLLGHQTEADVLTCLKKAPLLEDLKEWSHWELIYKPQFGEIETFLESQQEVSTLEVTPGRLLRIDPDSTVSDFIAAIDPAHPSPVKTAGHLVSLVVQRGSIQNTSPQLLASHVSSCLEKILASSDDASSLGKATEFIHDCLVRIPLKICIGLANEIFIEPLRRNTSSSIVHDVITHCKCSEHRRFFQSLGMATGIKAWADDFRVMLEEADRETVKLEQPSPSLPESKAQCGVSPVESLQGQQTTNSIIEDMELETSTQDGADPPMSTVAETTKDIEGLELRCRELVESIRHDNFGVGVELDEQQRQVAEKQREREGRGLKRLSSELYTKDTHFVLELIQNADDNSYLSSKALTPSLVFVINSRVITVLNNEVGFSEKNIRAICDVGKSTKGAHRSGYIGQKGIGFKSVFRVSDTPEIHSNGFHIRFDASADPIGFILPKWVEEDLSIAGDTHSKWTTKVMLPLKGDHLSTNMAKKFNDIQPSLLLFLHRLRSISIEDQVTGNVREMVRSDRERGVIEIRHVDSTTTDVTDSWLVVRRILDKAKQFKPDVEATELAFAFPLPSDLSNIPLAKDLQHQQVFAFLPLRSYGFRFILQGDFDLPSSREDVNSDSPWNQWLREEVPSLFLVSLQRIKELKGISEMEAVSLFLQFIPLEGELHDFFHPVTKQILNLLKGRDCLPTDPVPINTHSKSSFLHLSQSIMDDCPSQIHWKQPSQLLFVKEKFSFIRENIPQDLLAESLNLFYLNVSILPFINPSLQLQLGIGDINLQHLTEVAQTALRSYSKDGQEDFTSPISDRLIGDYIAFDDSSDSEDMQQPMVSSTVSLHRSFVRWVANWLASVHLIIEDTNDIFTAQSIESLKKLAIVPLENGSLASTESTTLFFPPEFNKGVEGQGSREYKNIFKELKVVDVKLFEEGDDLIQSRVRKVLERLGVRNLYPADIIRHHIVPVFTNSNYSDKPQRLLSSYLIFIKDCIERRGSGITEPEIVQLLKGHVVVVTNRGLKSPSKEVIHFSSHYKCDPDLQALFPDVGWTVMHEMYLKKSPKNEDLHFWRRFLTKLGVKKGLDIKRVDEHLEEDSQRLAEVTLFRRIPAGACTVRDWQCEEFREIIDSVKSGHTDYQASQMKSLAKLIDDHWEEDYAQCMDAKIYDAQNEHYLDAVDASSFKRDIVQLSWLPCRPTYAFQDEKVLFKGTELFDGQARNLSSLLYVHVPYIGVDLKSSSLLKLLGVKSTIDAKELVEFLQQWSQTSQDSPPFVTSVEHMRSVYLYLQREVEDQGFRGLSSEIKDLDLFQEEKLIFVPDEWLDSKTESTTAGTFHSVHSVCWIDPSTVLYFKQKHNRDLPSDLPKVLQLHYVKTTDSSRGSSPIQQAFQFFGVPEMPRVSSYISLLRHVSSLSPTPEPNLVKDFTSIAFQLVSLSTQSATISHSYLYRNLKKAHVFPSHNGTWVTLEDCLLENDSKELAKSFRETEGVHFLQWPNKLTELPKGIHTSKHQIIETQQEFIKICQIPKLSVKASSRITTVGTTIPENEIKRYLHLWIPLVQRFLATFCPQTYKQLKQDNIEQIFARLQCLSVDALDCRYSLEHGGEFIESSRSTPMTCTYTTDSSGIPVIYIAKSKVERLGSLLPALVQIFTRSNESSMKEEADSFRKFLTETIFIEQPATQREVEELAVCSEVSPLSEDDAVWSVPLPIHQSVEESSEESEDEEYIVEDEYNAAEGEPDIDSKEQTGLKSWPPKAALRSDDDVSQKHSPGTSQYRQIQDKSNDTIGEKDFEEMRSKYNIERTTSSRTERQDHVSDQGQSTFNRGQPTEQLHTEDQSEGDSHDSKGVRNTFRGHESDHNHPNSTLSPQAQNTVSSLPQQRTDNMSEQAHSSTTKSTDRDLDNVRHASDNKTRETGHGTFDRGQSHRMQQFNLADSTKVRVNLVSIEELVKSVQPTDGSPLIPLLDIPEDDPEYLLKVGQWGEQFVYTLLMKNGKLPDGRKIKTINWVNETNESGKPYDLELEVETDEGGTQWEYIDVKSTAGREKEMVAASWRELTFAQEQLESYCIYRVYGAGSSSTRVGFVRNLCAYFEANQTRLVFLL